MLSIKFVLKRTRNVCSSAFCKMEPTVRILFTSRYIDDVEEIEAP